ncbi:MAG: excinuclease ABC subunit UvrC [Deltaproteobacteria bacterium]|nr:excinuclease ABC subunit UvrC [Deltaproteobacteria bacterium]
MPNDKIAEKLKILPTHPGVYLWKDAQGVVIYVGKAKNLRHRVRSYHQRVEEKDIKTQLMVRRARDLDWIVTDSEKAALLLENTLIKKHRPPYNIRLRDDKNFLSIKLSTRDRFPRLYLVRRIRRDGSIYYGPFSSAHAARATFNFLNRHFLLRECSDREFAARKRPCIRYQIGRSAGPCCDMVSKEDYDAIVRQVRLFFEGKGEDLIGAVERDMERLAEETRFEEAARKRDLVASLRRTLEKQQTETPDLTDRDVFALYREGASGVVVALFVRKGKTIGQRAFPFTNQEGDDGEIIAQVVQAYYADDAFVPEEVLTQHAPGEMPETVREWLADLRGAAVRLAVPRRGDKARIVEMAAENAHQQFEQRRAKLADEREILESVRTALDLSRLPLVVECFDISNVQGTHAVGSQVTFIEGRPEKRALPAIQGACEGDARRLRDDARSARPPGAPGDGGGRLAGFAAGGRRTRPSRGRGAGARRRRRAQVGTRRHHENPRPAGGDGGAEDMIYRPGRKNPITFKRGSTALHFFQRVRDEAHRFAVEYHRKLRTKAQTRSAVDDIPGVGAARRKALVKHFGSVKRLGEASADDIAAVPGIGRSLAEKIVHALAERGDA